MNEDAHDGPDLLLERIGGDIGSKCEHVNLNLGGAGTIITQL
jgi:hypothetical protein